MRRIPITERGLAEAMGRLTLPLLALPAAYGVGAFQRLFVPDVVAAINAAAFEFVYISIALLPNLDRRRAGWVAVGSVAVSVLNNALSGWFATAPVIGLLNLEHWLLLAILHGAPLAIIAYLFAELLMDRNRSPDRPADPVADLVIGIAGRTYRLRDVAEAFAVSPSTVATRLLSIHTPETPDLPAALPAERQPVPDRRSRRSSDLVPLNGVASYRADRPTESEDAG